jgi:hypothetical protein
MTGEPWMVPPLDTIFWGLEKSSLNIVFSAWGYFIVFAIIKFFIMFILPIYPT